MSEASAAPSSKRGVVLALALIGGLIALLVWSAPENHVSSCLEDCKRGQSDDGSDPTEVEAFCVDWCKMRLAEDGTPTPK